MVYQVFDKNSKGSGVANNEIKRNLQQAEELYKPIIRKFKKRKLYPGFKDNIWGADLADMQLVSKFNKEFRFLLCVIDIFTKYARVIPLKDKKVLVLLMPFKKYYMIQVENQTKYELIKEVNFTMVKIMIQKCIRYIMKENLLLLKDLLEH